MLIRDENPPRVTTRAHKHTTTLKATIPDAVRKVLIHVPVEGGEVDHDSAKADDPNAAEVG